MKLNKELYRLTNSYKSSHDLRCERASLRTYINSSEFRRTLPPQSELNYFNDKIEVLTQLIELSDILEV